MPSFNGKCNLIFSCLIDLIVSERSERVVDQVNQLRIYRDPRLLSDIILSVLIESNHVLTRNHSGLEACQMPAVSNLVLSSL